ncbi:CorA metal ion transporter [Entomortierella chlamydospora]|nr:CorA metal ion transporter [Entomortierella chlamydospora]
MDQSLSGFSAATSTTPATRSRPSARRTPSELSALSKSILSLHDDHDLSQDSHASDGGSDRSLRSRQRSKQGSTRDRDREQDHCGPVSHRESTPLLGNSTRNSSYSFSQSIDTGNYTDSYEDSSPLLYIGSFVDHQPLQRKVQHQFQHQRQQSTAPQSISQGGQSSGGAVEQTETAKSQPPSSSKTYRPRQSRSSPHLSPTAGLSTTTTRSQSFSSQISHTHPDQHKQARENSNESSPKGSVRSSGSDANRDLTEDTLIMPQISTLDQAHQESERRRSKSILSASPETTGALPRIMTPSPVPLHARLSRIQKEAKRGARVLDMDNQGASHHYDYEDVTDSSYDFSSRRHSVAEEDVCYPLHSLDLEIDYNALEEYIRQEQIKTQKLMVGSDQKNVKSSRGPPARTKSASNGLLSRLKSSGLSSSFSKPSQESDYGTITGRNLSLPERSYSLFGERDKSQIPLDDAYRFTLYSTASVTVHAQTLGEIPPRGQTLSNMLQAGCFWLDVLAPTDEEIRMLSQVFRIHPLTTEDILMEEGREKCEMFLNYYFVCFRTFVLDPNSHNYLQALSVYTLVFPGGIISYHFRPVPHCRNVRKRIRHLKERMEVTPDWINYAIIDDIVDTFAPLIRQVETEVDMIDELVLILKESEQSDMLRRIGNCRKRVMSLLRLLTGKADVIKGLTKRYEGRMGSKGMGEIGLFMGDIQDHIITMLQNLSHYEKILSRSHSNYLAQINIEMTSASNETNDVLTKLTVLGSILLPMNLVTGLWGMNVPVPGQESDDLKYFFWIVTAIFLAASLFLLIARKTHLL